MGKRGAQALDRNPNWKGGRTTTEHGYVLVKRPDHPRADSRGYVYEHILVAEQMIGRPLNPGEEVHHDDLHRSNNVPSNLKVKTNHAWHFLEHRKPESKLRLPDEDNTRIVADVGVVRRSGATIVRAVRVSISTGTMRPSPLSNMTSCACCPIGPRTTPPLLGHWVKS